MNLFYSILEGSNYVPLYKNIHQIIKNNMSSTEIEKKDEYGCTLFIDTLDDHPQIITEQLGIYPSKVVVKGSVWLSPITKKSIDGKFYESNLWIYEINSIYSGDGIYLNTPLEKLLDIMDSHKDLFINILKKYHKNHILCYAYFYGVNAYFILNKHLLNRLNAYEIDLEFDMYCLAP